MDSPNLLTCAFGRPWIGSRPINGYHCIECARTGLRMIREFKRKVKAGELDAEGYTPRERRLLAKRQKETT